MFRLDNVTVNPQHTACLMPVSLSLSCCFSFNKLFLSDIVSLSHTTLHYTLLILFLLPMLPLQVLSAFITPTLFSLFWLTDISHKKPLLPFPAPPPMWIRCPLQVSNLLELLMLLSAYHLNILLSKYLPHDHEDFGVSDLLDSHLFERRGHKLSSLPQPISPSEC